MAAKRAPRDIAEYIAAAPAAVQPILQKIRMTIRRAAPDAAERISYGIPTFALEGNLVHFATFKNHIGFYPPVRDPKLRRETAIYAGEKGNLRFPLDRPIPYALITKLVKARVRESRLRDEGKRKADRSRRI